MAKDKRTIGITPKGERRLADLVTAGNFASELEAAKFAMAHAINVGVIPGATDGAGTKWNVGSVDPDASLRSLIEALYPSTTEPYRLVEHFMNEGLRLLDGGDDLPPDVVGVLFSEYDATANDGVDGGESQ